MTYQMMATINRSSTSLFDLNAEITLDVRSYIPRLYMQPKREELDSRLKFCSCFNFGPVNVSCSLPQSGFALGDTIPLTMEVENQSNKYVSIHASISRTEVYYSGKGPFTTAYRKNLSPLLSRSVLPGTTALLQEALIIPFTLPVSIINCPVFSINYFVTIQAISFLGSS